MGVALGLIYLPLLVIGLFAAAIFSSKATKHRKAVQADFEIDFTLAFIGLLLTSFLISILPALLITKPSPEPVSVILGTVASNLFIPFVIAGIAHGKANESSESQHPRPETEAWLTSFAVGAAHAVWVTPLAATLLISFVF
jgi:cytochrome c biogenesis protein CcdA